MKSRVTFYSLLLVLLASVGAAIALSQSDNSPSSDINLLTLTVQADKESYLPGELITLSFKVLNNTKAPVLLEPGADVQTGRLRVLISDDGGDYKQYAGPRWGLAHIRGGSPIQLAPGEVFETKATVLHNRTIETSHLNETAAAEATKDLLLTPYALPRSGFYFIKAVLADKQYSKRIESAPIKLPISEPVGDDLEVWNKIKDNDSFARFLHTGELSESPSAVKTKQVVSTLEEILTLYPQSKYAVTINNALSKHRALLERLNKASNRPDK